MSEPLLSVNLNAGYGKHQILTGLQFELARGEAFGLVGNSGAGKSTLIMALMGMLSWKRGWAKGAIVFEGDNLLTMREKQLRRLRGKRIALVPQSPSSALNGSLRLLTHFEEAWRAHERGPSALLSTRMMTLLQQVGLPSSSEFLNRKPGQISVGQAQRVVIALALLHSPKLIIADEPTSALDAGNRLNIIHLLRDVREKENTALLYVSHDLFSVIQLCQQMAVLQEGRIVESLPVNRLDQFAKHQATLELMQSLPVPARLIQEYQQLSSSRPMPQVGLLRNLEEEPSQRGDVTAVSSLM